VSTDDLTPAELAQITGKRNVAQQAKALIGMGVPFVFLVRAVRVTRAAAEVHQLLPQARPAGGIDFGAVRR
jgi:hypothetical protein